MNWQPGITLDQAINEIIDKALSFYQGNKTQTARALGISIKTIDNRRDGHKEIKYGSDALQTNGRLPLESTPKAPEKHCMPMRKR